MEISKYFKIYKTAIIFNPAIKINTTFNIPKILLENQSFKWHSHKKKSLTQFELFTNINLATQKKKKTWFFAAHFRVISFSVFISKKSIKTSIENCMSRDSILHFPYRFLNVQLLILWITSDSVLLNKQSIDEVKDLRTSRLLNQSFTCVSEMYACIKKRRAKSGRTLT